MKKRFNATTQAGNEAHRQSTNVEIQSIKEEINQNQRY